MRLYIYDSSSRGEAFFCHQSRLHGKEFRYTYIQKQETFEALVSKGGHPSFVNLHKNYPIKSQRTYRQLQGLLSALAFYSPVFGEVRYLPSLVFPFLKLFGKDKVMNEMNFISLWNISLYFFPVPVFLSKS